jgi:beta-lactamase class C
MSKRKTGLILIMACLSVFFYFFSIQESEEIGKSIVAISKKTKGESPANPYLAQLAHTFDSIFRTLMEKYDAPGASVAIVYDTTVVLLQGYGVRELNTYDSVDIHTVYRLASVSKPLASFLTGILIQENVLQWDDAVASHWPNFKLKSQESTREIKIRHVLSHTTGLPYHTYTNLIEEGLPFDTLLNYLRDVTIASKPGEVYSYQNVGYSIIGKVIEQATGKNYQTQLKEKVFAPLGMKDASTDYIDLLSNKNIAKPHLIKRGKLRPTIVNDTYYNVSPAGGVNASIADMANWLKALLGNRPDVIKKEILDSLFAPNVLANSRNRNFYKWNRVQQAYYGLGWRVLRFPNDTLIYHGGYVAGYRSEVALLPAEKIAICVLSNAPGQLIDNSLPIFLEIFDRYREAIKTWRPKEDLNL